MQSVSDRWEISYNTVSKQLNVNLSLVSGHFHLFLWGVGVVGVFFRFFTYYNSYLCNHWTYAGRQFNNVQCDHHFSVTQISPPNLHSLVDSRYRREQRYGICQ